MFKRRKILILVICGVIIAGTIWALWPANEPSYQGRSLDEWIEIYDAAGALGGNPYDATNAAIAVKQIGTNAIPWLLKSIAYAPRPTQQRLEHLLPDNLPGALYRPIIRPYIQAHRAVTGFTILGSTAAAAIPELTRLLNDSGSYASPKAALALGALGKDAFPPLLRALADPDPQLRQCVISSIASMHYLGTNVSPAIPFLARYTQDKDFFIAGRAVSSLGKLGLQPQISIPALTNLLSPTNWQRGSALRSLGNFGSQARPAIPAIFPLLTNSDFTIRDSATNALLKIAPEILTNAPPH